MHNTSGVIKLFLFLILFCLALCWTPFWVNAQVPITTRAYNNQRTGATLVEKYLNTTTVNPQNFGKLFTRKVVGQVYAQVLYVPNLYIRSTNRKHDVIFVATMANNLYAFDAIDPNRADPLWQINVGPSVPISDRIVGLSCGDYRDISVEVGIASTPVIDLSRGNIYVAAVNKISTNPPVLKHVLYSIDISSGDVRAPGPVDIVAKVQGVGAGSANGVLVLDHISQLQRASLALTDSGTVLVSFGTYCFTSPWHGWLLGYDAGSLQQTHVFCTTPNEEGGSLWMGGSGPAVEGNFVYFGTANGEYNPGAKNYGDSIVKVDLNNKGNNVGEYANVLNGVTDHFAPFDQARLYEWDLDFATGGIVLIPGTDLCVVCAKSGNCYMANKNNMGGYNPSYNVNTQTFRPDVTTPEAFYYGVHAAGVVWDSPTKGKRIYYWPANSNLRALRLIPNGNLGVFDMGNIEMSNVPIAEYPGGILSLSALGSQPKSGVVWAYHTIDGNANHGLRSGMLRAFDAEDVKVELWNSQMNGRDSVGVFGKFNPPIVANGRVYIGTFSNDPSRDANVHVYGILNRGIAEDQCRLSECGANGQKCCGAACYNEATHICLNGVVREIGQPNPSPSAPPAQSSPAPSSSEKPTPSPAPSPSPSLPNPRQSEPQISLPSTSHGHSPKNSEEPRASGTNGSYSSLSLPLLVFISIISIWIVQFLFTVK